MGILLRTMAYPEINSLIQDPLLFARLESSSPFGYWIYNPVDGQVKVNNTLAVLLDLKTQSSDYFLERCLGSVQIKYLLQLKRNKAKEATLYYCGRQSIHGFKVSIVEISAAPDLLLVQHLEIPKDPWKEEPFVYPYLMKLDSTGAYCYYNSYYEKVFLGDRDMMGKDAFPDVLPHSREACANAAGLAFSQPGTTVDVRLEKIDIEGHILTTAWQFLCLKEGEDSLMLYARGYDSSLLKAAEQNADARYQELSAFVKSDVVGVFFMMLAQPQVLNSGSEEAAHYLFNNLKLTKANAAFLRQYDFPNEESCLGLSPVEFSTDDWDLVKEIPLQLLSTGSANAVTNERKADGTEVIIEADYFILRNEGNQVLGIMGLQHDITESVNQREQLRQNHRQMHRLTGSIPGAVFQLDESPDKPLHLAFLSDSYSGDLGLSKAQLREDPASILEKISPKDYSTLLGSVIYASRNQSDLDAEFRIENKLGEEQWYRVVARPQQLAGGGQSWYGLVSSIQGQKADEDKQFKLAQIARNTSDLIMVIDANQSIDWVNASFLKFFELEREQALHKMPAEIFESGNSLTDLSAVYQALEDKRSVSLKLQFPLMGKMVWLHVRTKPVWNANGEFLFSVLAMQDIDQEEIKNLEMESLLNLTSDQNKRLQSFTYIISHNIRSHSANLQGLIETIEAAEDQEEKEELWDYLRQVSDGLESTIKHLNEIIVINQSLNKNKQELNLKREIDRVLIILAREMEAIGAKLICDFDPNQGVMAVKAYLESILLNLLTNALRYRDPSRKPEIKISTRKKDGFLTLTVRDNGLGIDLNRYGDKLFQLYQTFHNHPNSRGLGLYILKSQVDSMGGEVKVESQVGVGTAFKISLPLEIQK